MFLIFLIYSSEVAMQWKTRALVALDDLPKVKNECDQSIEFSFALHASNPEKGFKPLKEIIKIKNGQAFSPQKGYTKIAGDNDYYQVFHFPIANSDKTISIIDYVYYENYLASMRITSLSKSCMLWFKDEYGVILKCGKCSYMLDAINPFNISAMIDN